MEKTNLVTQLRHVDAALSVLGKLEPARPTEPHIWNHSQNQVLTETSTLNANFTGRNNAWWTSLIATWKGRRAKHHGPVPDRRTGGDFRDNTVVVSNSSTAPHRFGCRTSDAGFQAVRAPIMRARCLEQQRRLGIFLAIHLPQRHDH